MKLGRYKFILTRVQWYFVLLMTLVQIITVLGVFGISLWWLTAIIPTIVLLIGLVWHFDKKYVVREEARTWLEMNPDLKAMLETIIKQTEKAK
jgi:hypothetical protein